ncbi:Ribonucleoside-diphosphate reductase NrdZ [Planctomycetes bacterium Poly30]|uniref:Vitamin B12-dependent ribonucleotide reductase n=1 Tax=Saltatorellus ferox TaxID=2528018 RepID=A0A518F135_9BACT|nr:Ribonucleoside-diphosphate reductase NrdZ [Planctomycetes bacterium Poly30]
MNDSSDSERGSEFRGGDAQGGEYEGSALDAVDPPADLPDPDVAENALTVLERRYLIRNEAGELVETPRQLFWRVARTVARAELKFNALAEEALEVARDYYTLMSQRMFLPNSPCLSNAGRGSGMLSACFVLPVTDSVDGIYDAVKATALIQKAGGGTGFSFSSIRAAGERVDSSGGSGAGPLTFMEVFSKASDSIQQGAFRKGANMGILRIDHPDVGDFIVVKDDRTKLTNFNISVAITDAFIEALERDPSAIHEVKDPHTGVWRPLQKRGQAGAFWTVGELWTEIIEHAHATGEPGLVFIDRINAQNPIKNVGAIEATNPCGEQPLHAWDSCNLGSINLGRFVIPGEGAAGTATPQFHWDAYREVIHTCTRFLDDVIEVNEYPLREIAEMSRMTRRIGLGVMGFADALFELGIPYDSAEALSFAEEVMRVLDEESHLASEVLAEERGVFAAWEGSEWEKRGVRLRNSYTTTIAPTGTISIIAGCSGGIEPMFSLAFERQVMRDTDGTPTVMREVNEVFERVATASGYFSEELIEKILEEGTLAHIDDVPEAHRELFVTAHDIAPESHVKMQAAFQRHCDAAISKTINFPNDASIDDVRQIYDLAIDLDLKGVTVYRDGCREMQPMALKGSGSQESGSQGADRPAGGMETEAEGAGYAQPGSSAEVASSGLRYDETGTLAPIKLPEIMPSLRIRQMTPFGNMHVKVSVDFQSGREREVFAQLGKGGDVANSDLEAICRILSLWLRSNGSLEKAVAQLSGIGSSLSVPTKDGRIMSLADGLATALLRYKRAKEEHGLENLLLGRVDPAAIEAEAPVERRRTPAMQNQASRYKVKCPTCSGDLSFQEGCVKCNSCGFSQC